MTLEEFEGVELTANEAGALMKARRMACFTINKMYMELKDSEHGLTGDEIDIVKDATHILTMTKVKA